MDDLISRQAAIDAIKSIPDHEDAARANALGLAENAIMTLPPVQPKRGYWTESHEHVYMGNVVKEWTNWYCSECDAPNDKPTDFCPNCGADMREVKKDGTD